MKRFFGLTLLTLIVTLPCLAGDIDAPGKGEPPPPPPPASNSSTILTEVFLIIVDLTGAP